jgi:hypothetical protein
MRVAWVVLSAAVLVSVVSPQSSAGIVDVAVGVYGGVSFPVEDGASAGTAIGAKVRVLPPIPMIGVEAYYTRIGQGDARDAFAEGDLNVAFDGDTYDIVGVDVLVGAVRVVPGFRWYGVAGVNFVGFEETGSDEETKIGGELGVGLEVDPPILPLGIEVRATVAVLNWEEGTDRKLATVTAGLNYYF